MNGSVNSFLFRKDFIFLNPTGTSRNFFINPLSTSLTASCDPMVFLRCSSVVGRISTLSRPLRLSRGFASLKKPASLFSPLDTFPERHIGPDDAETSKMLSKLGYSSMEAFIGETVPQKIRVSASFLDNTSMPALSESQLHERAKALGALNKPHKNFIGMGYHAAVVPPVILRNVCHSSPNHVQVIVTETSTFQVLENPAWYTPYTPYQPEIAQGMSDMVGVNLKLNI